MIRRNVNTLTLFALCLLACSCNKPTDTDQSTQNDTGYPEGFTLSAYYSGNTKTLSKYPLERITHLIYSFVHLDGNKVDTANLNQSLRNLTLLKKKYPNLKILIALGGWGGCETCSEVFSSAENRQAFALSVKNVLFRYELDGIDLDWEYPVVEGYPGHPFKPEDKQNFTALVTDLRNSLGNEYEITFAAGGFTEFLEKSIEWQKVMAQVDRVNIMSYDLYNGYSTETGHHAPLYSNSKQNESTDNAVQFLLKQGIEPEKIVIGAAFYARVWKNVKAEGGEVLYVPAQFDSAVSYNEFNSFFTQDFQYFWDDAAKAPYFYNATENIFATFDDPKSVILKTQYSLENKLGGIMFWQLGGDRQQNGLLKAISAAASGKINTQNL